ncbi:phosphoglycerate dehydrogenase [Rhodococcus fascians]|nr:phosphoglycerate dehydrogenase [Rhodococcus fascians]
MGSILVTTDYLAPGDEVDKFLCAAGHVTVHSAATGHRTAGEMQRLMSAADAALIASEPVTAEMMAAAPYLRVIARSGVGYDSIDVDAATARGIVVCNTPGANKHAVAEMTMTLLLMCAKRIGETMDGVKAGLWPRHDTRELRGATLGIIGLGPIGRAVAELALAFGMSVLVSTGHPDSNLDGVTYAPTEELLRLSDFVTLHARANADGTPVIDRNALASMKQSAYLINTARGTLVDELALIEALQHGQLAGAGLDVFAREPVDVTNPLLTMPNVVSLSHLAGQTREARAEASLAAARDIVAVLEGRTPRGAVNTPFTRPV